MLLSIRKKQRGAKYSWKPGKCGQSWELTMFPLLYPISLGDLFARGELISCKQGGSDTLWKVGIQAHFPSWRYLLLAVKLLVTPIFSLQISLGPEQKSPFSPSRGNLCWEGESAAMHRSFSSSVPGLLSACSVRRNPLAPEGPEDWWSTMKLGF